jgi:L-rhamnose mutarotase
MARSSTQTFSFTTLLAAGRERDYEQFHRSIPAALDHAMRSAGVVGWRIHRDGTTLTHFVEALDRARMEAQLGADPVNLAWQDQVAPFLAPASSGADALPAAEAGALIWDFSWPTRTTPER